MHTKNIKKFLLGLTSVAATLTFSSSAHAALFASGDTNILSGGGILTIPANQTFLKNISGNNVLVQTTNIGSIGGVGADVSTYLTSQGIANTVLADSAVITAADLASKTLFIGALPSNNYTSSEIALLSSFLSAGNNVLLTGDYNNASLPAVATANAAINSVLGALGSSMTLVPASIGAGYLNAVILTNNSYTNGTAGFQYAATSTITGGTPLYGTSTANSSAFLSYDLATVKPGGVPEPATWASMLAGFGLVGSALRRGKARRAQVA